VPRIATAAPPTLAGPRGGTVGLPALTPCRRAR